jgi:hypothetical protein
MFCKAMHGVSDVVVCQHFKIAITKIGTLTMEDFIADPGLIAQILHQTSKWAKNSVYDSNHYHVNNNGFPVHKSSHFHVLFCAKNR